MELSLSIVPGIGPDEEFVAKESGKAAGIAVGAAVVAAIVGRLVGAGPSRTFYGLALVAYAMLRARDNTTLAVGLGSVGMEALLEMLLSSIWRRVAPAGGLPTGATARTPLPYRSVAGWA